MDADALLAEAQALLPEMSELRRALHREPELGLELPRTQRRVLDALDGLPLDVEVGEQCTSVIATLRGTGGDGPTVLLRADMDALPLTERTGVDYASTVDGAMHACGHDGHVAMVVAAAQMLCDRRDSLHGTVRFMFQPGEEGHHGARVMLDEGVLDVAGAPAPSLAFALHATPVLPPGQLAGRVGAALASGDRFVITVQGRGGHASTPHLASDPIPTACEIVLALQTMVTRRIDVFKPGIITVGKIAGGTTYNVIPPEATIHGTIRAVSRGARERLLAGVVRVAEGIAAAHDQSAGIEFIEGYPVTVNADGVTQHLLALADELVGADNVTRSPNPTMGTEDFSYVLERVPGAMLFVGVKPDGLDPAPPAHSDLYLLDERGLATGAAAYVAVAVDALAGSSGAST